MNPYKNSSNQHFLNALFYEMVGEDKSSCLYTLKDEDHKGFKSLKKLFLSESDVSEYRFARKYLDSYIHWKKLLSCSWFEEHILAWREELRTKLSSLYLSQIEEIAAKGGKEGLAANRYLLERLEKPTGAIKRGRPYRGSGYTLEDAVRVSKAEVDADAKRMLS